MDSFFDPIKPRKRNQNQYYSFESNNILIIIILIHVIYLIKNTLLYAQVRLFTSVNPSSLLI